MYLASYCKEISHLSLSDLVKTYCKDQEFRLHCADEDSKALKKVFINLHLIRKIPSVEYCRNDMKLHKVYLKSVPLPSDSKEVKAMMKHLNPGSNEVLLSNSYTFGVYGILERFHGNNSLTMALGGPQGHETQVAKSIGNSYNLRNSSSNNASPTNFNTIPVPNQAKLIDSFFH